jgi:alpha-galactosidase
VNGLHTVRDLWRQKDVGIFSSKFSATVGRHGVLYLRLTPVRAGR